MLCQEAGIADDATATPKKGCPMAHDTAASIIVFDVNETLLDITTLEPLFERVFGDPSVLREWFAQLILYSQTMTLSGLYTPFGELGVGSLRMLASIHGVSIADGDIEELKTRMNTMPAHADVVPALSRLRAAGFRLVTLTNSASASSPTPLERAGIGEFFERSFSVESVRKFKPAPETYRQVAEELRVETSALCLVACHLWDTIGAQAAGCRGALVTRPHNAILPAAEVPVPDVVAAELTDLAEQIVQRWK
jgi:2-haloacid dehalogenase